MEGAIFMSDPNDILRVLAAKAGGSQALSALEQALSSAEGRRAVSALSASHEAMLRRAAENAAAGGALPPRPRAPASPTRCAAAWEENAVDNDALSGLLNDPDALRRAMDSVSSLLGTPSDAPSPPPDDAETRLLPVLSGIMQGGRAAVNPDKRALMTALRPVIAQDVALQFDRALRLVGMAGMARAALSELEHRTGKGGDSAV